MLDYVSIFGRVFFLISIPPPLEAEVEGESGEGEIKTDGELEEWQGRKST